MVGSRHRDVVPSASAKSGTYLEVCAVLQARLERVLKKHASDLRKHGCHFGPSDEPDCKTAPTSDFLPLFGTRLGARELARLRENAGRRKTLGLREQFVIVGRFCHPSESEMSPSLSSIPPS